MIILYSCIVIIHLLHCKTVYLNNFYYAEGGPYVSEESIFFGIFGPGSPNISKCMDRGEQKRGVQICCDNTPVQSSFFARFFERLTVEGNWSIMTIQLLYSVGNNRTRHDV